MYRYAEKIMNANSFLRICHHKLEKFLAGEEREDFYERVYDGTRVNKNRAATKPGENLAA